MARYALVRPLDRHAGPPEEVVGSSLDGGGRSRDAIAGGGDVAGGTSHRPSPSECETQLRRARREVPPGDVAVDVGHASRGRLADFGRQFMHEIAVERARADSIWVPSIVSGTVGDVAGKAPWWGSRCGGAKRERTVEVAALSESVGGGLVDDDRAAVVIPPSRRGDIEHGRALRTYICLVVACFAGDDPAGADRR